MAPHHTESSTATGVVLTVQQVEELLTANNINTGGKFKRLTRLLYTRVDSWSETGYIVTFVLGSNRQIPD